MLRPGLRLLRYLAPAVAAATALSLLPLTGLALAEQAEGDTPGGTCPPVQAPAEFTDRDAIPEAHRGHVDEAAALGVVAGFADGEYKPRRAVTRAQMASFVFRALCAADVAVPPAGQERFVDVPAGSAHDEAIHRLAAAGVMRGGPLHLPADRYGPQLPMRRDQMASFLMRGIGYAVFDDPDHFQDWPANAPEDAVVSEGDVYNDVPSGNAHYGNVNAANWHTVVLGFLDGTYRPASALTRDQLGTVAVNTLFFLRRPTRVEITEQPAKTATVGEAVTVTATVTDQLGNPWDGFADVRFRAEGAGVTPAETQTVTTDGDGHATFEFTASRQGTVRVTASVDGPGGNFVAADGDSDTVEQHFAARDS